MRNSPLVVAASVGAEVRPFIEKIILLGASQVEMKSLAMSAWLTCRNNALTGFTSVLGPPPKTAQFPHSDWAWELIRFMAVEAFRTNSSYDAVVRNPIRLNQEGRALQSQEHHKQATLLITQTHPREFRMAADLFGQMLRHSGILD